MFVLLDSVQRTALKPKFCFLNSLHSKDGFGVSVFFQLMVFGFMLCLDCFLFMFTFLPLRLIVVFYKILTGLLFCRTWVTKWYKVVLQSNPPLQTPLHYRQFDLSLGKESPYIFSKFNPLNTDTLLIWSLPVVPSMFVLMGFDCNINYLLRTGWHLLQYL